MGFDGPVVSDWDGVDEVQACSKDKCAQAINAGIDMVMVPTQWKGFLQNTITQVNDGTIPEARIDELRSAAEGDAVAPDRVRAGAGGEGDGAEEGIGGEVVVGGESEGAVEGEGVAGGGGGDCVE